VTTQNLGTAVESLLISRANEKTRGKVAENTVQFVKNSEKHGENTVKNTVLYRIVIKLINFGKLSNFSVVLKFV
jgi:hypothetical protein